MAANYGEKGMKELLRESINVINSRKIKMKKVYLVYYEYWSTHVDMVCSTWQKARARCEELRKQYPELPRSYAYWREFILDTKGQNPKGKMGYK